MEIFIKAFCETWYLSILGEGDYDKIILIKLYNILHSSNCKTVLGYVLTI